MICVAAVRVDLSPAACSSPHLYNLTGLAAAQAHGIPVSQRETLFSTPEDLAELEALLRSHPYPAHTTYIRCVGPRPGACSATSATSATYATSALRVAAFFTNCRRGHGFFVLGNTVADAEAAFQRVLSIMAVARAAAA